MKSNAPLEMKVEVNAILDELEVHLGPLTTADLSANATILMARMTALSAVGVDLFRLLRGEQPEVRAHRRSHVSASLRHTRSKHEGRAPTASDYPAGHILLTLVWVYYGSFETWGRGAPVRAQQPKWHWRQRANQVTALRDVALRFPGQPMTHALLGRAGYQGLANVLSGLEIAMLAAEIGLDRHLAKRANGWWTAERCIDLYAGLCRERRVTLSSHALARIGGDGCTIRAQFSKHYSSFAMFQAAAVERHSDLRPPKRPETHCGIAMDSWGEVVVFEAIRRAFPDVRMDVHIRLPEGRSCDILVDRSLHVEVLGVSLSAIAAPKSRYESKYAANWTAKMALYDRLGVVPLTIEPDDVNDPVRMAARISDIAARIGIQFTPTPSPTGGVVRAKGVWTFEFLCEVVTKVSATLGGLFPTHAQLIAGGYGHAAQLLRQPNMTEKVADATSIPLRNRKGLWTDERVVAAHVAWVQTHGGHYPTAMELRADGKSDLASARLRNFARRQHVLRNEVGRRCGQELPPPQLPTGSYDTQEKLAVLIKPLCVRLGRFPTGSEISAELPETVYAVVSKQWGMQGMAAFMGVPYDGPRSWTRTAALAEFRVKLPVVPQLDGGSRLVITCPAITRAMGAGGIGLMQRYFRNIAGLRTALAIGQSDSDP